jgi:hypothetical protein
MGLQRRLDGDINPVVYPTFVFAVRVVPSKHREVISCTVVEDSRLCISSNRPGGPCKRDVPDSNWPMSICAHASLSVYSVDISNSSPFILCTSYGIVPVTVPFFERWFFSLVSAGGFGLALPLG